MYHAVPPYSCILSDRWICIEIFITVRYAEVIYVVVAQVSPAKALHLSIASRNREQWVSCIVHIVLWHKINRTQFAEDLRLSQCPLTSLYFTF